MEFLNISALKFKEQMKNTTKKDLIYKNNNGKSIKKKIIIQYSRCCVTEANIIMLFIKW